MDEPWIMTVKGPHGIKGTSIVPVMPLEEPQQPASLNLSHTPNHRPQHNQQQSQPQKPHANGASRSPPKETNLNHHKNDSRDTSRDGQNKHTPVSFLFI